MAKLYWNKYHLKVESEEMTIEEVLELVPQRWKTQVKNLFGQD